MASSLPSPLPQAGDCASQPGSLSRVRERAGGRVERARQLRHGQTEAEARLWKHLRDRQLLGLKFRRPRPIGPYFADFACLEAGVVIELDGGQHNEDHAVAQDQEREAFMRQAGLTTLRFWNHEVLTQTEAVLEKILLTLQTLTPALSRKRERE